MMHLLATAEVSGSMCGSVLNTCQREDASCLAQTWQVECTASLTVHICIMCVLICSGLLINRNPFIRTFLHARSWGHHVQKDDWEDWREMDMRMERALGELVESQAAAERACVQAAAFENDLARLRAGLRQAGMDPDMYMLPHGAELTGQLLAPAAPPPRAPAAQASNAPASTAAAHANSAWQQGSSEAVSRSQTEEVPSLMNQFARAAGDAATRSGRMQLQEVLAEAQAADDDRTFNNKGGTTSSGRHWGVLARRPSPKSSPGDLQKQHLSTKADGSSAPQVAGDSPQSLSDTTGSAGPPESTQTIRRTSIFGLTGSKNAGSRRASVAGSPPTSPSGKKKGMPGLQALTRFASLGSKHKTGPKAGAETGKDAKSNEQITQARGSFITTCAVAQCKRAITRLLSSKLKFCLASARWQL